MGNERRAEGSNSHRARARAPVVQEADSSANKKGKEEGGVRNCGVRTQEESECATQGGFPKRAAPRGSLARRPPTKRRGGEKRREKDS